MASTASAGSSMRVREEAGPLPRKVGELGFPTPLPSSTTSPRSPESTAEPEGAIVDVGGDEPTLSAASPIAVTSATTPTTSAASSETPLAPRPASSLPAKRMPWYRRVFSSKGGPLVAGVRGPTAIRLVVILLIMGAAIVGWVFSAKHLAALTNANNAKSDPDDRDQVTPYLTIAVHVAFAVLMLVFFIVLERTIFVIRAERWLHTHPGETLPLHRGGGDSRLPRTGSILSTAPWNRPPLPNYAAALGYRGTGDAEDEVIQAPPPPAYGNTRGSVLLLASALRHLSGTANSPAGTDRLSHAGSPLSQSPREFQQISESRPASYVSAEAFEEIQFAQQLEHSLAQLESGESAVSRH